MIWRVLLWFKPQAYWEYWSRMGWRWAGILLSFQLFSFHIPSEYRDFCWGAIGSVVEATLHLKERLSLYFHCFK